MKRTTKVLISVLMIVTILGSGVLGATIYKTVTATIMPDIKVVVDGQLQELKDASGNIIYPVAINGTTYLPVRALGDTIGKGVDWDPATKTVYLGAKTFTYTPLNRLGTYVKLSTIGPTYGDILGSKKSVAIGEMQVPHEFENVIRVEGYPNSNAERWVYVKTDKEYTKVKFKVTTDSITDIEYKLYSHIDGEREDRTLVATGVVNNGMIEEVEVEYEKSTDYSFVSEGFSKPNGDLKAYIYFGDVQFGN